MGAGGNDRLSVPHNSCTAACYGYQAEQYLRGRYLPVKQVHNVNVPICPDSLMHEKPSGYR